jgi:hypothetical protein
MLTPMLAPVMLRHGMVATSMFTPNLTSMLTPKLTPMFTPNLTPMLTPVMMLSHGMLPTAGMLTSH